MNIYKIEFEENGNFYNCIIPETKIKLIPSFLKKEEAKEQEIFDFCIKEQFLNGMSYLPDTKLENNYESNFGLYLSQYKKNYDRYFSKNVKIKDFLSSEIKQTYNSGLGNEFKTGKFYSVASSSRFTVSNFSKKSNNGIIELINKININGKLENIKISLEKNLSIEGIEDIKFSPQMDVMVNTSTKDTYFIEVKCHEIFQDHKSIKLKWKYINSEIFRSFPLNFNEVTKKIKVRRKKGKEIKEEFISINNNFLEAKDFGCNISTTHFDFKQFLCHLMGILSYKKNNCSEKVKFYYLFYRNNNYIKNVNNRIYSELEKEMAEIFSKFGEIFPEIDFGFLYNERFDTLKSISKENT